MPEVSQDVFHPIEPFLSELQRYFHIDPVYDCISRKTVDGASRDVFIATLRREYLSLAPRHPYVVIRELSADQANVYSKLSKIWNPHLETVFGVFSLPEHPEACICISEFIERPSGLSYPNVLLQRRSLSLEDFILHFGPLQEIDAAFFCDQLCIALQDLEHLQLTHGDLAPQNLHAGTQMPPSLKEKSSSYKKRLDKAEGAILRSTGFRIFGFIAGWNIILILLFCIVFDIMS